MKCPRCDTKMKRRSRFVSTDALIRGYNYKENESDLIIKDGIRGKYIPEDYCTKCDIVFSMAGGIIGVKEDD